MDLPQLLPEITDNLKASIIGAGVGAIIEPRHKLAMAAKFVVASALATVAGPASADVLHHFFTFGSPMEAGLHGLWGAFGLVVAEGAHQVLKRVLKNTDEIGDRLAKKLKITGGGNDKDD